MRYVLCLFCLSVLTACGLRPVVSTYPTNSAQAVVKAWADAYNADEHRQLVLLLHPNRQDTFLEQMTAVRQKLKTWVIRDYKLGDKTLVNQRYSGHTVRLTYHNGSRANVAEGVIIEDKGRWWVWSY